MENKPKIGVQVFFTKRKEYWIAYCPALKTFGYSNESEDAAFKDLDEAINTFFQVHKELGSLNRALLNLGWRRVDHSFQTPKSNTEFSPYRNRSSSRQINVPAYC